MTAFGLELASVSKSYGERKVVDRLSLRLPKGALLTLLGPSGCGKTTVLRMIAGFVETSDGDILIDGTDVTRLIPERRPTSIMFQSYALFPHMTVAENVAFGLRLRGERGTTLKRRVSEMLDLVGLGAFAQHYPSQLSGGQQQRTALARSLVIGPKVLLLDEPFAALDRDLRERMQIELRKLQQSLGITMVVVTHDQHEALILSDYVAVMNGGRIEQFNDPTTLYDRPATRFVAGFMGIPNLLDGRLEHSAEGARIALGALTLPVSHVPAGLAAGPVAVALRREELMLRPIEMPAPETGGRITGRLRFARPIGSQIAAEVETEAGLLHVLAPRQGFLPELGAAVALHVPATQVVVMAA